MAIAAQKKKVISLDEILAAAEKLSEEEKQLLKVKLLGNDIINELKIFEAAIKKEEQLLRNRMMKL